MTLHLSKLTKPVGHIVKPSYWTNCGLLNYVFDVVWCDHESAKDNTTVIICWEVSTLCGWRQMPLTSIQNIAFHIFDASHRFAATNDNKQQTTSSNKQQTLT
jgi:hypothetical protein